MSDTSIRRSERPAYRVLSADQDGASALLDTMMALPLGPQAVVEVAKAPGVTGGVVQIEGSINGADFTDLLEAPLSEGAAMFDPMPHLRVTVIGHDGAGPIDVWLSPSMARA